MEELVAALKIPASIALGLIVLAILFRVIGSLSQRRRKE